MTRTLQSLGLPLLLLLCTPAAFAAKPAENTDAISHEAENAVVKVFSTMRYPDVARPWTKQAPAEATGTGVVIEGKRILTNAHVVLYASQVQIQANQAGDKISATVEAIAPGIDLAVLKLDDDSFFDTPSAAARAPTCCRRSRMRCWPTAFRPAAQRCPSPRASSRASSSPPTIIRPPACASRSMPRINPGNSGGPAVVGDKMIGLAFSRLAGAENIGYIIPNEEIELFLQDIADGHYDGKPAMFDELQTLENPALRSFLKLDRSVARHRRDGAR